MRRQEKQMFCMFARSESSRSLLSRMAGDFRKPWAWGASLASLFIHSTERFPMLSLGTEMARALLSRFLPARVNQPCSRRLSYGVAILHLFELQFSTKLNVALFREIIGFIERLLFKTDLPEVFLKGNLKLPSPLKIKYFLHFSTAR